jgi:hypothetical protein
MAKQHGRALTSVAYAAHRGLEELDPIDIGTRSIDDKPQEWEPLPLSEAFGELTRREDEPVVVPPLVILDQLVRLASSPGRARLEDDEATSSLERLVGSLVADPSLVTEEQIKDTTALLKSLPARDGEDPWPSFAGRVTEILPLTVEEVNKPLCNDRSVPGRNDLTEITVVFWTDRKVRAMAGYVNPTNWPACSTYFAGMVRDGPSVSFAPPPYCGWEATLVERLALFPPYDFVTPLRFTSYRTPDWTYLRTAYRLPDPTDDITEDAGFIEVATDPKAPDPARPTRVTATKVIRFRSPALQRWTHLACDTFWTEMAIQMALDCSCAPAGPPAPPF